MKVVRQFLARTACTAAALLLACGAVQAQAPPQQAPPAGGVQAGTPKFHVVRSVSGTKGSEQGSQFVIEDPRTVFYVPEDQQVIVYFEWEGPLGHHRLEGQWKTPSGKVSVISEFDYESRAPRFGGYWTLKLSQGMAIGMWTLEASVDGEVTGAHVFQVIGAPRPPEGFPSSRPMLPLSEIYKRVLAASVFIEKFDAAGEHISTGSGYFSEDGALITAFQVVDGARSLRIIFPDGRRVESRELVAWNRWQDWAIVGVNAGKAPTLNRAKSEAWSVGDRCFMLDTPGGGSRVILEGSILGRHDYPRAGLRMSLSFDAVAQSFGSPVVNEYGEVIGVVGGSVLAGQGSLGEFRFGYPQSFPGLGEVQRGILAVPANLVVLPAENKVGTTFDELAKTGQFMPPLGRNRYIAFASLSRRMNRSMSVPMPTDESKEFSVRDKQMFVYINFDPKEKRKALLNFRIFDLENRSLGEGKATKISLNPGSPSTSRWTIPIDAIGPGIYRVDVVLDNDVIWRSFFRITN